MQYFVYRSTGKNTAFPLLVDVTSDIIGDINRRLVIPLMPAERIGANHAPERLNPILTLVDGKEYVLMAHEAATIPIKALGTEFCNACTYRNVIKGALDFMLDGV
ncbi:plasmid maintenance protein CcdB [Salmonella enterica subsp. enterica serovar Eastbourne]|nr:plasmid maintenance protein CcdB [Salmonella enterica]ECU0035180.1 plasmid maintenance protein CcdB [Salmonella enterica subsp. enterica serovar Eastbourne]EAR4614605.1 plasmid maintenance protein CcdB [Salmonella enterica]EAR7815445.1 plasmid maintenance protein CcdB [Salmonella enterica]EDJ6269515.1 plasmid maintenance protein CcdB [Salmonella enterica]